jgi:site-specific recombinase XerD
VAKKKFSQAKTKEEIMRKSTKLPRGVFQRDGVYWVRYADQSGRIHREKVGPFIKQAQAAYQKRKSEVREGKFFPKKARQRSVGFAEIAKDALEYSKANKVSAAYKADSWHMETLLNWFRERRGEDITPQDIDRKLSELADEGRKPATLNRYRALVSLVYSLAMRNGKVTVNPARLVRLRQENNARARFLDEQEEAKLRKVIARHYPERERDFDLAVHTGMRRGEQYGLWWENVDLKRGLLTIPRSKHGEKRHIPINSVAHVALTIMREQRDDSGFVCKPLKWDTRGWFAEAVRKAEIADFHWHDLRHTFASRLVMAGVDLRTVQELMGHKTIAMTVRYSHLAPSHQREAIERLTVGPTSTATSTKPLGDSLERKQKLVQV